MLGKSWGDGEDLGQGGVLEHWGARGTEHAAQGRPKLPVRGSWLRTLARGVGSRAPCRPAGVPCPSPAGPRPFLTYQGSRGRLAAPLVSSGLGLAAGRPGGGASGWQSAEGTLVPPGARPPTAPSASGGEGGRG